MSLISTIFMQCASAVRANVLIERTNQYDKEFHFQNWFKSRLDDLGEHYDEPRRNAYPDFKMVRYPEGYELKGLSYPGRMANFDCNSRPPRGKHNGRQVYYVFGRYPARPNGNRYPVLDLVVCHGSFLTTDSNYEHKNESFSGFGSFGDILVRDRKMYVAPTPFALVDGTAHNRTLILPERMPVDDNLFEIATLTRREATHEVVAYRFDMRSNELNIELVPNPDSGKEHVFKVYRINGDLGTPVSLAN